MKILIIDDSLAIRSRIVKSLLNLPSVESILQCKRIPEAEEIIVQAEPDVIVTEFFLLTHESVNILHRIKRNYPHLTLIVLTDDTYGPFLQKCKEAGADHAIHKLHDFEKLPAILSQLSTRSPEEYSVQSHAYSY